MTRDRAFKNQVRAYAAAHGMSYTAARNLLLRTSPDSAAAPAKAQVVSGVPDLAAGGSDADYESWFPPSPSADDLVGSELRSLFADLLNEPLAAYGLDLPGDLPQLEDPYFSHLVADLGTLEIHADDDFQGATLATATMEGRVKLTGALAPDAAAVAAAAGLVEHSDFHTDEATVEVSLASTLLLEISAGVLYDTNAETSDLQEVFHRRWI